MWTIARVSIIFPEMWLAKFLENRRHGMLHEKNNMKPRSIIEHQGSQGSDLHFNYHTVTYTKTTFSSVARLLTYNSMVNTTINYLTMILLPDSAVHCL